MKIDLDVRTQEEWDMGHKPDAVHFDLERLEKGELPPYDSDTQFEVYCRSGGRAGIACGILQSNGFTNVHNAGGF
jgi:phage shock protein E